MTSPSEPTSYLNGMSSLEVTGLRPHIVTGLFLQLMREHFTEEDRIESQYLKDCIWVPKEEDPTTADPSKTTIRIDPVYRWNRTTTQQRPGIIIKRGAITPRKVGIGMNRNFGLGEDDFPEAGSKHIGFMYGSHSFLCIAGDGGMAEILADEVTRHIMFFAPKLLREFGFSDLEIGQIGEVAILEEEKENFVVPVAVKYAYQNKWRLTKQEPRLKGIIIENSNT